MLVETFRWWLVIGAIGLVALPITLLLFRSLPGRGIAFARPLGLLLTGYLFWLALTLHVLPNRPGSIVWVLILLLAVDYFILRRNWRELREAVTQRWGLVVAVEVVFLVGLFVAAHIRSHIPEISGTEKPMDFMFLNAASRSTYYPPDDPWLSGFGVSYYYFGYVINAMIGRLASVPTEVAFNLAVAGTAALAATAAFGLGYEIVAALRRVTFRAGVGVGVGAVLLVTVLGNLEGVLEFGAANNALPPAVEDAADIANLDEAPESDACLTPVVCIKYPTDSADFWWWWRATRISPDAGTITEFPFFSFILGDLHPHVMAIPFVLTAFGVGMALWRHEGRLSFHTWRAAPAWLLLSGVIVGGLAFLNTWDLPAFGFLVALLVVARNLSGGSQWKPALRDAATFIAPLLLLAVVLYAPFYASFSSQAGFADAVQGGATRPMQALLFWGPLMTLALALPVYVLISNPAAREQRRMLAASVLPAALLLLWAVLLVVRHGAGDLPDAVSARGWNWATAMFFAGGLVASVLALWSAVESRDEDDVARVPVLAATSTAMLLVLGAEFFFVTDVFGSRLNTVFKLYYQAWLLLGVSGAAGAWLALDRLRAEASPSLQMLRGAWTGVAALLVAGALLYPLGATLSRTEGLSRGPRTLDGLEYAQRGPASTDIQLVQWLRSNAGPDERIVEAVGRQYSNAGRISAWSGVPAVLGWSGHERQWGRDADMLGVRDAAVDVVYRTASLEEALSILQQYGVSYVVVGSVERQTYPPEGLQKFEDGLQAVITSGNSTLYRLPPVPQDGTAGEVSVAQ